jgi:hypothetical protein
VPELIVLLLRSPEMEFLRRQQRVEIIREDFRGSIAGGRFMRRGTSEVLPASYRENFFMNKVESDHLRSHSFCKVTPNSVTHIDVEFFKGVGIGENSFPERFCHISTFLIIFNKEKYFVHNNSFVVGNISKGRIKKQNISRGDLSPSMNHRADPEAEAKMDA